MGGLCSPEQVPKLKVIICSFKGKRSEENEKEKEKSESTIHCCTVIVRQPKFCGTVIFCFLFFLPKGPMGTAARPSIPGLTVLLLRRGSRY